MAMLKQYIVFCMHDVDKHNGQQVVNECFNFRGLGQTGFWYKKYDQALT